MPNPVVVTVEGKPRFKGVGHISFLRHHSVLCSTKGDHEEENVRFPSSEPILWPPADIIKSQFYSLCERC